MRAEMSSIVNDKEVVLLTELGPYDVLLGRGTGPNENQGNRHFREKVRKGEDEYCRQSQSRVAKDLVVLQTIEAVRERGGRFVRRIRQCKKTKSTNKAAAMKRNQAECCDLYEVELKRDIVIEKVRQAFQYCRRRPTADKRSNKKNKLSIKSSPDESLLGAKKTASSSGGQQNPTDASLSRTAGAGVAGTTPTTPCYIENETQRHAAVSLLEKISGACSKKSYSQQQGQDEQVQKSMLIASIMGNAAFQEQQRAISILQQRDDGGGPVQDPVASSCSKATSAAGASGHFTSDLGRSSYSTYPSTNAAVPNLQQFLLSRGAAATSVVAPSNALLANVFSPPFTIDTRGTLTHAAATTRRSRTFSPHQQALAVAPPSGMRGVGLQQQLSNVLDDHQHLLVEKIRKVLFENPRPPPAPPLIYSLFQDPAGTIRPPNSEYY
jgi:hypothetical protein